MKQRQDNFSQALGACIAFHQNNNLLSFETAWAKINIEIYRADILRVRAVHKDKHWEDFSYAVVATPQNTPFDLVESTTGWELKTKKLILKIKKAPFRISLHSLDGTLLNADDEAFGMSSIGHGWYSYKQLQPDEVFIGLGEKTGHLNRRGKWYEHWNTDAFAYGEEEDPLYMSTPFYMGITQKKVYGIFLDNTYRSLFNFGASNDRFSYFQVPDGELDYFLFHSGDVKDTIEAYTWLTGRPTLPPKWSLGYQQCRYSYYPDKEVLNIARTFREKHIPCDVIYLDIHYMDQYKVFTWNGKEFPDPAAFIKALQEMNFQVVVIIDPGVKIEQGYQVYETAKQQGLFVQYPDGSAYSGEVWPGNCHFPDFTKPETRNWWGAQFRPLVEMGIKGFWNDMNEPVTWGKQLPDLIEFDFDGYGATHRKAHNVYGMQMARATAEGVSRWMNGERAFILSRAGFSGSQRFAASWTGDNSASDEHMLLGVRLMLSMGLAGLSFTGVDIGGFVGEAIPALFTRWMQLGAFSPLFRGHTMINSRDSEPWSYGEEAEEISRNFIRLRYRLMPYLYTSFYQSAQTGIAIARSLAFEFAHDPLIFDRKWEHEYLFGDALLVAAVNSWLPIQKVYLPAGDWYDFYHGSKYEGARVHTIDTPKEILPVFVKAGAVLGMQLPGEHATQQVNDRLDLHIFPGDVTYQTEFYEDDGISEVNQQNVFALRQISHNGIDRMVTISEQKGNLNSAFTFVRLYFHGQTNIAIQTKQPYQTGTETIRFIEPISNFDPFFTNNEHPWEHRDVPYVEIPWLTAEMQIGY